MTRYEPDDSAERVSRFRAHASGNHEFCLYHNCKQRKELEYQAEETIFTRAVFDELARRGIDPELFWGDGLSEASDIVNREIPAWLPQDVDSINRLKAKGELDDAAVTASKCC